MEPDFAKLRAERNQRRKEWFEKLRSEGWGVSVLCGDANDDACYCACSTGGPCEHKWDGEWWTSDDGASSSVTCSRCGMTAMSHHLRCAE